MQQFLLGVDEAGRGPLAGPVAVGIVRVPSGFDVRGEFAGVGDSKVLTEKKRGKLFEQALLYKERGDIDFCVRFASAQVIDTEGIMQAVQQSVFGGVHTLAPDAVGARVLLDGLLAAPPEYEQLTIVKGDATEPVISLASIVAKVSRDRLMHSLAEKFPEYGFEKHKGYGTSAHYAAIAKHGLCEEHRKTFCHL